MDDIATPTSLGPEETIWKGNPSHWTNFGVYLLCGLFCWLVIPLVILIYKILQLRSHKYELTTQRFRESKGVFTRHRDDLELYRVKDITLEEPFLLRMFGLGNIVLDTSDKTTPVVTIKAVKAEEVIELIRKSVETIRLTRNVREIDME